MEVAIKGKDIVKEYRSGDGDSFFALNGVNIEIPKGKLAILKGRSGSGKTTLLNILSTLDVPTKGEVLLEGESIVGLSEKDKERLRRLSFGYVFQAVALIPVMNAYENVEFALKLSGYKNPDKKEELTKTEKDERVKRVLSLVGMEERMKHFPGQLSGGEQQRVAIARAMVHKPRVIFADEPTGALDTDMGIRVVKLFKSIIKEEQVTIVMTTHDPGLMELGDVVFEMEDGRIR
ncbi:MAG: ABC transporter ATP-binding protein [Lachnospiraceae bacterium]|nr:ABC transporter ATP-binding protein [Lachnospiraceae bacterium]